MDEIHQLKQELIRFEDIVNSIPDRKERIIIRCRYGLGMNEHDTAIMMGISRNTVSNLSNEALQ